MPFKASRASIRSLLKPIRRSLSRSKAKFVRQLLPLQGEAAQFQAQRVMARAELGYPTDSRSISAGYPNYSSGGYHGGIDFPVRTGSNVYAAASGKVILVKYLNYSYGRYIIIDHGNGLSTLYAHNSSIEVSVGDKVSMRSGYCSQRFNR